MLINTLGACCPTARIDSGKSPWEIIDLSPPKEETIAPKTSGPNKSASAPC